MDKSPNTPDNQDGQSGNLGVLMDVQLPVAIRFGETEMLVEEIVKLGVGSVIELNSAIDQPVELIVNNRTLARGDVVTVDGFYGIKITEITSAGERLKNLNG
jgi:flagellar motor switch protein FliN/FliY